MKKNIILTMIVFVLFISLNILLPPKKTELSNHETPPSNSTLEELTFLRHYNALKEIPFKYVYEDIPSFNLKVSSTEESSSNELVAETLDEELYSNITTVLGSNINKVGLLYYNLTTKEYIAINENMDFVAASTYKVGLNLLYYYYADEGKLDLNSTITYYDYFYQDGTGILCGSCYAGMEIPIKQLLDLSIIYSDNIATAMLSSNLGGYNAVREQLYTLLDIDYILYDNYLTPAISAKILKFIYDNNQIEGFNHLLSTMKVTMFHDSLDKYIPQNLVAHKIGSIDSYVHDIGIVYYKEPYLICIFTEGLPYASNIIANISKLIYNKHTNYEIQFKINHIIYDKY